MQNMKPNELMFDDYITVVHTHRQPTTEKVYGIGQTHVLIKMSSGVYSFEYERIQPIPITEEFLQKNGFCSKHNELFYIDQGWYLDIEGSAIGSLMTPMNRQSSLNNSLSSMSTNYNTF